MAAKQSGPLEAFPRACKNVTPSIVCDNLQSAHSLPAGPPEPHHYKFESRRVTSSPLVSPKDQVVSSGSHPAPPVPVSDPGRVCCVRAKPCPRRLNDQGLPDSYGVYRSPWINCSFARHLVVERYTRTVGGEETRGQFLSSPKAPASSRPGQCDVPGFFYLESRICIKPGEQPATCMAFGLCLHACHLKRSQV